MIKPKMQSKVTWIVSGFIVVLLGVALLLIYAPFKSVASFTKDNGLIIVKHSNYEIAFYEDNGAIAYLNNASTGENVTLGNRENTLWWAFLQDDKSLNGKQAAEFSYDWSRQKGQLSFHYGGVVGVDVKVRFSEDSRIYFTAEVDNQSNQPIKSFRFPNELKVQSNVVQDALLPMLPGAKLKDAFFKESNSYQDQYPGVMFAPYVGLRTSGGDLALYDLHDDVVATVDLGFKNQVDDSGKTGIVHNYKTWINPQMKWTSPSVVLELGGYESTIASFRELSKIDEYRALSDKLGEQKEQYYQSPFYKLDISAIKDGSWSNLTNNYVNKLNYEGVLHLVGFQKGGHDENYPDFYPPDAQWGGEPAFKAFVKGAKDKGNLVIPYTNMSWWGNHSPTLAKLPSGTTMEDLIVRKDNGAMMQEDYGRHSGFVVNTGHPFFAERTAIEHQKLIQEAGFNGIFEDQWGIRNSPYVFNESIPEGTDPSSAYFQGVRNYFKALTYPMYMEDGTDVLANDAVGFMGSTYLWDTLGYRKNTAMYTEYYPMASMLLRDKVMLFHHDLAAETMTDDPDMLRWNLAMGYNLSTDLFNGVSNPWIDLTGIYQKYILSSYVDALVQSYEQVTPTVTRTNFGKAVVTANWDKQQTYNVDGNTTLAPGGYEVIVAEANRRAGSYSRLNGLELDEGEHHIVQVRNKDKIVIYQPIGADTTLRIEQGAGWPHAIATAYQANGKKIADLAVKEQAGFVEFDYIALIKDQKVAYVELTSSEAAIQVKETFEKVKVQMNVAVGQKVFATSMTAEPFAPEFAVDGDPYTYWESTSQKFPQSLTLDLGAEKTISKLILKLPPQDAWEARDQEIEVLVSADGNTFRTLIPSKAYTFDPKKANEVVIELGETHTRFVRLTVVTNTAWPAAQISEVEAY